jgi:hypothetical protein
MYSRNYINDELLSISIRNSNEALLTSEDLCAWSPKPAQVATQYNFFPIPKPRSYKPSVKSQKERLAGTSFKRKTFSSVSPYPKNNEKQNLCKSLDEAEYKLLDLRGAKYSLPPLKLSNYNLYYRSAAKESTLEGFLSKCKEMIKESKHSRMKSASPSKYNKKIYLSQYIP